MSYRCQILADSLAPNGARLVTYEIELPRPVLAELNTHCVLARNSASSRAIPVVKMIRKLITDTYIPVRFGINQAGMQASEYLRGDELQQAREIWIEGRNMAIATALKLLVGPEVFYAWFGTIDGFLADWYADPDGTGDTVDDLLRQFEADIKTGSTREYLNVHKQNANRVLEPYLWHTVIITATEWDNFFALRAHPDADPAIATIAHMMQGAYASHQPTRLEAGQWHLPLIQEDERKSALANPPLYAKISAARCARVSYLTHDGKRDIEADLALYKRLTESGHMSPLEHVGFAQGYSPFWSGKFFGFTQFRKTIPNEHNFALVLAEREAS